MQQCNMGEGDHALEVQNTEKNPLISNPNIQCKCRVQWVLDYGAQLGLYTLTGRWYAFNGPCGEGVTTGGGVVS